MKINYLVRLEMGGGGPPGWLLVFTYGISGGPAARSAAAVAIVGGWSEFRGARSIAELRRRIIKLLFINCRLVPGEVLDEFELTPAVADIIAISHVLGWWRALRAEGRRSSTSLESLQSFTVKSFE